MHSGVGHWHLGVRTVSFRPTNFRHGLINLRQTKIVVVLMKTCSPENSSG